MVRKCSERALSGSKLSPQSLRAKQAQMLGYAIICQADLYDGSDAADLAMWIVLFYNSLIFSELEHKGIRHIIETVKVEMAIKVHILASLITDIALTKAFQSVVQCPADLCWTRLNYCFEATKDRNHYMVNLLTGCVLVNAAAPGVLPQHIINSGLYKRSFGNRNFEVITITKNVIKTTLPIDDKFTYEFSGIDNVVIREISDDDVLELVSVTSNGLPKRLLDLYSHWYSERNQMLFFRGIPFNDRGVAFVIKQDEGITKCFQVTPNICAPEFDLISSPCLLSSDGVTKALSKFEREEFIHVLHDCSFGSRVIRWELKRYGLSFTSKGNIIDSVDHCGYLLSKRQQLEDFSSAFTCYLLLEKGTEIRLLIPNGKIVRSGDNISIEVSQASDVSLGYYSYDKHVKTGEFKCSSTEARLHLAVICAAASSLLPIPMLHMTGCEFALKLLKQCWVNRPHSEVELSKLQNLQEYYFTEPGLVVRELDARCEAAELNFLHGKKDEGVVHHREIWSAAEYELKRLECSGAFNNKCRKSNSLRENVRFHRKDTADISEVPVKYQYVKDVEERLQKKLIKRAKENVPFPFIDSILNQTIKDELLNSWNNYIA